MLNPNDLEKIQRYIDGQSDDNEKARVESMLIKEMENWNMEWKMDMGTVVDKRIWNPINIWVPIPRVELNKAPNLQQNPGYI